MGTTVGLGAQTVVLETCCACAVVFGMAPALHAQRLKDHEWFYCPNGHKQHYTGETDEQRRIKELERQVANEKARAERAVSDKEWAESSLRGARIQRGKAEAAKRRLEARVHAGVCPCCNRTFQQLARHMKAKHPDVVKRG